MPRCACIFNALRRCKFLAKSPEIHIHAYRRWRAFYTIFDTLFTSSLVIKCYTLSLRTIIYTFNDNTDLYGITSDAGMNARHFINADSETLDMLARAKDDDIICVSDASAGHLIMALMENYITRISFQFYHTKFLARRDKAP